MSDTLITKDKLLSYFEELEDTLKNQVMFSPIDAEYQRERFYDLFQATQLLKARVLQDFKVEYQPTSYHYDEELLN